ncbi:MAG: Na(+)-translocating NADH-quinone reductase subunit A [Rikenellaceae bacterium]
MSEKVFKIKRGLDINLVGGAEKKLTKVAAAECYALRPSDFHSVVPKLLVKVGDELKVGSPIFFDKAHPEVLFTSPVAGSVKEIVRGEKRKILEILISPSGAAEAVEFKPLSSNSSSEEIKETLLGAGYWPMIIARPFGLIADSSTTPRDIFISGFDSSPLAPDLSYILKDEAENISVAIAALKKLTSGDVHIAIDSKAEVGVVSKTSGAKIHRFEGKHPVGNVGVQIEKIAPIAKDDLVWTINITHLAMIGKLLKSGKCDFSRTVALTGSCAKNRAYYQTTYGVQLSAILEGNINAEESKTGKVRVINGNVLSGTKTEENSYLGFYNNAITLIPEGDYWEAFGWIMPRFQKFSTSKTYFSWLTPKKKFNIDTNTNGGERAFVTNGNYEEVMPMNIYPVYLLKAIMAGDIDKMEELGIYEVIEEDLALCEFICPSKIEWQDTLREGITKMIKEL